MKKAILIILSILTIQQLVVAQISFVNGPESVEYDPINNRYLASSPSDNKIYSVVKGGSATVFVPSVTSPYGMVYNAGVVYVCCSGGVKGFDVNTAAQVFNVPISGSSFLNGICTDNAGHLFATDFSGKKVYKINISDLSVSTFLNTSPKTPNGILWDESASRLVYCTWGTNAGLYAINMSDSTTSLIKSTTDGNFDGVVQDNHHNYYISSWSFNGILKVDSSLSSSSRVVTGLSSPADIYYNLTTDTLAVPNSGDSISFHFFGTIDTTTPIDTNTSVQAYQNSISYFTAFQNQNEIVCKWAYSFSQDLVLEIHKLNGEQVYAKKLSENEIQEGNTIINTDDFSTGIYILTLTDHIHSKHIKIALTK
ncbi:MAG: hypothetical protein WCP57_07250 [Bacteroidota bacterium]